MSDAVLVASYAGRVKFGQASAFPCKSVPDGRKEWEDILQVLRVTKLRNGVCRAGAAEGCPLSTRGLIDMEAVTRGCSEGILGAK